MILTFDKKVVRIEFMDSMPAPRRPSYSRKILDDFLLGNKKFACVTKDDIKSEHLVIVFYDMIKTMQLKGKVRVHLRNGKVYLEKLE